MLAKASQPDLNCISSGTVVDLISGYYNKHYKHIFIIGAPCSSISPLLSIDYLIVSDCRFPYEFHGGHIKGARNFPDGAGLEVARPLRVLYEHLLTRNRRSSSKIADFVHWAQESALSSTASSLATAGRVGSIPS